MTDSTPIPAKPRLDKSWTQSLLFGFVIGIGYLIITAVTVHDSPALSAYSYGFLIMVLIGVSSWRWPGFMFACWLGALLSAPMSAQVAGSAPVSVPLLGTLVMTIPIAIPFLIFLVPHMSAALRRMP